jgi:hypothetical protein
MGPLQAFDQALIDSTKVDGDAWADDGLVFVGRLASKLSDDELALLGVIWSDRPLPWQKHCAEVMDQARHGQAIELLLDFVDRAKPEVALAALESLREFDPGLFGPERTKRILAALQAMLERPVGPLDRVVLETFLDTLRSAGAAE